MRAYYAGGPRYGYSGWVGYQARNGCKAWYQTKLDDGQMYACQ